MKTSRTMQSIITKIAEKHGLDLTACEAHLRLEQQGYMPLVIEKVGRHLVSVAHYFRQNGDTIADPDVVFYTGYGEWVPIEIQQVMGYQCYAEPAPDGASIQSFKPNGQADLAAFCNMWARNLKEQRWLEDGRNVNTPQPAAQESS